MKRIAEYASDHHEDHALLIVIFDNTRKIKHEVGDNLDQTGRTTFSHIMRKEALNSANKNNSKYGQDSCFKCATTYSSVLNGALKRR